MPRLSRRASTELAAVFAPWFEDALNQSGATLGSLSYATRPHVVDHGTELSHSNLTRLLRGESAPSPGTVLRLVPMLCRNGKGRSTLSALNASHLDVLAKVVIGLDQLGLDDYWNMRSRARLSQLARRRLRERVQERMGLLGNRAITEQAKRSTGNRPRPTDVMLRWIDRLQHQPDLLAICIAYAYLGTVDWDEESVAICAALDRYNPKLEALYARALDAYEQFDRENDMLCGPELYQAEEILRDYRYDRRRRIAFASNLFAVWSGQFAEAFINAVPLLEWVEQDTLRANLEEAEK